MARAVILSSSGTILSSSSEDVNHMIEGEKESPSLLYKTPPTSSLSLPTRSTKTTAMAPIFIVLTTFLLLSTAQAKTAAGPTAAPAVVAPGPTPAPLNLSGILDKGGQYTTLMRLLKETQVGVQIQSQLNSSFDGLTLFAPTDNAFNSLKAGTLNSLDAQDQVGLVLYHVLPRYYSLALFQTTSNPVRTQASGSDGVYSLNITTTSNQVNVSTGVDETQISNSLYSDFPLAVYSVDKVLLPSSLFGPKAPAAAPLPSSKPKKPSKVPAADGGPSSSQDATTSAASLSGRGVWWGSLVVGVASMWIVGSVL